MDPSFLPVPKTRDVGGPLAFNLDEKCNVFVNKAKIQDHVMDFFGFTWRSFKIKLRIMPIRDRDFEDVFDAGFFMHVSHDGVLPSSFPSEFTALLEGCKGEGYTVKIDANRLLIVARTLRGFFNGVLTLQQLGPACQSGLDETTNRAFSRFPGVDITDAPDLAIRAVHVDLKFQLHSLDYLKDHVRTLARYKINAIVWEWEDKFPYTRRPELRHKLAFDRDETKALMELCNMYGIESIPLVQTFGHLEFVLKHEAHRHLLETRDVAGYPNDTLDICPLQDGTMPLIEDMIADVVSFHPKSRYFHVGGDEVYSIGTCSACKAYVEQHGNGDIARGKGKLYVMHLNRVIKVVKGFGKVPMIWHDYLLKYPDHLDDLDKDVVVVYWMYGKDEPPGRFASEIAFFTTKGFKVLVASSVRSDFQHAIPNYSVRFQNMHELHLAAMQDPSSIVGTLATSWAVCRAPMETTMPGLLFFADNAWTVPRIPYGEEMLERVSVSMLEIHFGIPRAMARAHGHALALLERCTVPPLQSTDLEGLAANVDKAISTWESIAAVATTSTSIMDNVLHGLQLQRLRVSFFSMVDRFLRAFEDDGEWPRDVILALASDVSALRSSFEQARYKSRDLYQIVMYDDEVREELALRFEKPARILDDIAGLLHAVVAGRGSGQLLAPDVQARLDDLLFDLSVKKLHGNRPWRF